MGSKKKIGVRVDEALWERFTSHVEDTYGRTHGVVGSELERALVNHMEGDQTDAVRRIEEDISSINAGVSDLIQRIDRIEREAEGVEADGGSTTLSRDRRTHTHTEPTAAIDDTDDGETEPDPIDVLAGSTPAPDSKPGAKATKAAKAAWVFGQLESGGGVCVTPKVLENKVSRAWSFGDRATSGIIETIYEKYHAEAVYRPGTSWHVALGKTPEAREAAFDDWASGHNPDDVKYVAAHEFEGFDTNGKPKTD